jgi:hypothetical protein
LRKARYIIGRLCERAALGAAIKADECLRRRDLQGELFWKRVMAAIIRVRLTLPVETGSN